MGATRGLAMLPNNHAIHDNTMGSYTTSISWRSLGRHRNKAVVAHAFLVIFRGRPRNLSAFSWCPPSPEKRSSLLVFSLAAQTLWFRGFPFGETSDVFFFFSFLWCRHTRLIASPVDRCSPFSVAILDCQHSNSMAFRHRRRQSEFAPSFKAPQPL